MMTELLGLTVTGILLIPAVVVLLVLWTDVRLRDPRAARWFAAGLALILLRTCLLPFFEALPILGLYLDLELGLFDPDNPPPPPSSVEWPPGPYLMGAGLGLGWLILQLGSLGRAVGWVLLARGLWLLARPVMRQGLEAEEDTQPPETGSEGVGATVSPGSTPPR